MKKVGAGNCVPLPMRLLYSAEEKFTGGKHDFKVQCETSLYRACGSCAGHRARCGLVVKNDDRSASGYEFSVCDGCHNRYGSKSEQVESDVTAPIESAMATTSNIKNISSVSYNSYSVVTLEYEQNANMDSVVIEIQQSLDQVSGQWDDSIGTPMIMKVNPDMMPVLAAAVDKDGMDANALSDYVKNDLAPALESLEGVASVTTTGQLEESVDVTLDQDKIDALNKKIQKKIDEQFEKSQKKLMRGKRK